MFCGMCGASVREDAKFCPNCGAKIQAPGSGRTEQADTEDNQNAGHAEWADNDRQNTGYNQSADHIEWADNDWLNTGYNQNVENPDGQYWQSTAGSTAYGHENADHSSGTTGAGGRYSRVDAASGQSETPKRDKKAQRSAKRAAKRESIDFRKSRMVWAIMGCICAGAQILCMFIPMVSVNVSYNGTSYATAVSYMELLADYEMTYIVIIVVIASAAELLLFLIGRPGFAQIPNIVNILNAVMMSVSSAGICIRYGGWFTVSIGVFLCIGATIAAVCVPFIKFQKK